MTSETEVWFEIEYSLKDADDWFREPHPYDEQPVITADERFDRRVVKVTVIREVIA